MITLTICIGLVLLAGLNAFFGLPSNDWILPKDRELFLPPIFKSEGFYRSFLINITFASIATAATGFQYVRYTRFFMWNDPLLAIFSNLVLCVFAAISLRSDSTETRGRRRAKMLMILFGIGAGLFVYSVSTAIPASIEQESAKNTSRH